jgi:very-short-patch-repair endonuclease
MASSKPRAAIVHGQPVGPEKIQFAKLFRRTMTGSERLLCTALRRSQLNGLHFRRQQIAGDFVLDFYCDEARLAIELDGSSHDLSGEPDEARDADLARMGIAVVRIANDDLMKDPDLVAGWIAEQAAQRIIAERGTT